MHILSIFRQKNVKGVEVGRMVPLRSATFFEKKRVIFMVQKHKVGNIRTTSDIFEATLGQPLALNFETILGPEGDYLVTIGGAYLCM